MTSPIWKLAHGRQITLGPQSVIMGILNVTPDSFSDGGRFSRLDQALEHVDRLIAQGAQIVDIGGESTRPGAAPVSAAEEQDRILPLFEALAGRKDIILSVDTYRAETARLAVAAGAHIVNDVWGGQREPDIADVAARTGAGLVIMHTGRGRTKDPDVIADQFSYLRQSLDIVGKCGVEEAQVVVDPGFGFAKDTWENLQIMSRFEELADLSYPLLVGTSRKRFVGAVTGRENASERDVATAATSAILRCKGAAVFRVHDVAINRDALAVADAMLAAREQAEKR
ncbi:dihydropteroate synthase [Nitratireductor sp. GISD-1A_MAKvit]|uniref:dihydropteroate synthase n=1 Tax=Nitratireductor sp. GISD-1A_MAKvit TaxID=3234198 RepID=UPI0034676BBE